MGLCVICLRMGRRMGHGFHQSIHDCFRNGRFVVTNRSAMPQLFYLYFFIRPICLRACGGVQCAKSVQYMVCLFVDAGKPKRCSSLILHEWWMHCIPTAVCQTKQVLQTPSRKSTMSCLFRQSGMRYNRKHIKTLAGVLSQGLKNFSRDASVSAKGAVT